MKTMMNHDELAYNEGDLVILTEPDPDDYSICRVMWKHSTIYYLLILYSTKMGYNSGDGYIASDIRLETYRLFTTEQDTT